MGFFNKKKKGRKIARSRTLSIIGTVFLCLIVVFVIIYAFSYTSLFSTEYRAALPASSSGMPNSPSPSSTPIRQLLDIIAYNKKIVEVANYGTTTKKILVHIGTSTALVATTTPNLWPVKTVYPNFGALLPFGRIVAYYGNFYSTRMGVLGEYPEADMLARLDVEVKKWQAADPTTPVIPAIDYIAVTAQASPGADGKYRLRMPASQLDYAVKLADKVNGIVVLDVQVGLSTLQTELPLLEKYLKMPEVHLAVDPEFSVKTGAKPGTVIGSLDADDINYAANYLAGLVRENNLPPKILVIHRFTVDMVTNYKKITPLPEVEMIMDMDGWGDPAKKLNTYDRVVHQEPVQFTGFKLFYKNDLLPPSTRLLTPEDLLKLRPQPLFIQFQ